MKQFFIMVIFLIISTYCFSQIILVEQKQNEAITAQLWHNYNQDINRVVVITLDTTIKKLLFNTNYVIDYVDKNYVAYWTYNGTGGIINKAPVIYQFFILKPFFKEKTYYYVHAFNRKQHLIAKLDSSNKKIIVIDIFTDKIIFARTLFKTSVSPNSGFLSNVEIKNNTISFSFADFGNTKAPILDCYKTGKTYSFKLPKTL